MLESANVDADMPRLRKKSDFSASLFLHHLSLLPLSLPFSLSNPFPFPLPAILQNPGRGPGSVVSSPSGVRGGAQIPTHFYVFYAQKLRPVILFFFRRCEERKSQK